MLRTTSLVLVLIMGLASLVQAQDKTDPAQAEAQIAELLADLAQRSLQVKSPGEADWRRSRELLMAANRLNPKEPRFARLVADAWLQAGDAEKSIAAITEYRKLVPKDSVAVIQLIDLYLARMETADAKLKYLKDIIGRNTVPDEAKSHAAYLCVGLLQEQGQTSGADNMLQQSLRLSPVNLKALRLKRARVQQDGTPAEHVAVLLAMLKSNPVDSATIRELGDQLAQLGLLEQSIYWYQSSIGVAQRKGEPINPDDLVNYVSALLVQEQNQSANQLVGQLVKAKPQSVDAQFLRLLTVPKAARADMKDDIKAPASNALYNQLMEARQQIGVLGATTRPYESTDLAPAIDFAGDTELLQKVEDRQKVAAYVRAATDLAWYRLYFIQDSATAEKIIATLKPVLPENNITLARLSGWADLVAGRKEEAKAKLAPIQEQDPMAAMGLVKILSTDPAQSDFAKTLARKTLSENPSGLTGAFLFDGLGDLGAMIVPGTVADAVKSQLDQFPKDWLRIVDQPQGFYLIRGEPVQASYGFREPILGTITLQNLTDYDLTIGNEGVIHPDLWFDGQVKGVVQQAFGGIAYDRINAVVLKPRSYITQTVRLDRGELYGFMGQNPTVAMQLTAIVTTNPIMSGGGVAPGACGYRVQFTRFFSRTGTPMSSDRDKQALYTAATSGPTNQRFYTVELLASYAEAFQAKEAADQLRQLGSEFTDVVNRLRRDPTPAISIWATVQMVRLSPPEKREDLVKQMLKHENWLMRYMGIYCDRFLTMESAKALLGPVAASDADPGVKSYADAELKFIETVGSTAPKAEQTPPPVLPGTTPGN